MSRPPRYFTPLWVALLAAFAASPANLVDDAENYRRLQAMPRERRVALSENLERFDKLDRAEQSSIRKLDAELARLDPVEQARYRSLLRRYHLWANGLSAEQKGRLDQAGSPEARFNLALKFRLKELESGAPGLRAFGIRTGENGLTAPHEAAYLLKIWNRLTAAQKLTIEKLQERGRLFDDIRAQSKGVTYQPLPQAEREQYVARLEADEDFRKYLELASRKNEAPPKKEKGAANVKRPDPRAAELQAYAEFLYYHDHKPKSVSQTNLERFSATCPDWLHAMIESLSADDARAYLTILYRLLYPEPTELPADAKPARPSTPTTPGLAKPGAKKSGPVGPF